MIKHLFSKMISLTPRVTVASLLRGITTRLVVTEVDDDNFEPNAPEEARACYGNQIGCNIRTTATINDEKLNVKHATRLPSSSRCNGQIILKMKPLGSVKITSGLNTPTCSLLPLNSQDENFFQRRRVVTPRCNDATVTPGVKLIILLNKCLIIFVSSLFQIPVEFIFKLRVKFKMLKHEN